MTFEARSADGADGDVVSGGGGGGDCAGQAEVEASSLASCDSFPAASNARTPTEYQVPHVSPERVVLGPVISAAGAPFNVTR